MNTLARGAFYKTKNYTQRIPSKEWKQILIEEKDTIVISGEVRQLVAKNMGSGVLEISLKPKPKPEAMAPRASDKINKFLDSKYSGYDGDYPTWRHYIATLLTTLYVENESFSGKRPLGNSGWEGDIAIGMMALDPKVVTLYPDDDTLIKDMDDVLANKLFTQVVKHIFGIK